MYQFGDCVCPGPFQHGIYSLRADKKKKTALAFFEIQASSSEGEIWCDGGTYW